MEPSLVRLPMARAKDPHTSNHAKFTRIGAWYVTFDNKLIVFRVGNHELSDGFEEERRYRL